MSNKTTEMSNELYLVLITSLSKRLDRIEKKLHKLKKSIKTQENQPNKGNYGGDKVCSECCHQQFPIGW